MDTALLVIGILIGVIAALVPVYVFRKDRPELVIVMDFTMDTAHLQVVNTGQRPLRIVGLTMAVGRLRPRRYSYSRLGGDPAHLPIVVDPACETVFEVDNARRGAALSGGGSETWYALDPAGRRYRARFRDILDLGDATSSHGLMRDEDEPMSTADIEELLAHRPLWRRTQRFLATRLKSIRRRT